MNGRKARMLRKVAGGNEAVYVQGTPPIYFDISTLPNAPLGMAPTFKKTEKGVPTKLKITCSRTIYQACKKVFRHSIPTL